MDDDTAPKGRRGVALKMNGPARCSQAENLLVKLLLVGGGWL
jgi:hypothetical protein